MRNFYILVILLTPQLLAGQTSLEKATKFYENQEYAQAASILDKLIQSSGSTPEAYEVLVKCYADQGWGLKMNGQDGSHALTKALQYGHEAVKSFSQSSIAYRSLGYAYHFNQQFTEAQAAYEQATKLNPKDATSYFLWWTVVTEATDKKVESPLIKKVLELDPNMVEAWEKLGDFYNELKQFDNAIKHYEKALSIKPNYVLYYSLGSAYGQQGDLEKAEKNFKSSIELQQNFAWSHYGLATVYLANGSIDKGASEINTAIGINPAVYDYYQSLLSYYPDLSKYQIKKPRDKAIEKSQNQQTGVPEFYNDAIQLTQEKKYVEAINTFNLAIKKENAQPYPNKSYLISMFNWMMHCYYQLGKYAQAIEQAKESIPYTEAYGLQQDIATLYATLAAIYDQWGDYKNAIAFTEKSIGMLQALNLKENEALAFGNLCEIYRNSGKYNKAINAGEKAKKLNKQLNKPVFVAQTFNSIAKVYLKRTEITQAKEMIDSGFQIMKSSPDLAVLAELQLTRAEQLNAEGKFKEAMRSFKDADQYFSLHTNRWHPSYKRILKVKAFIYGNNGDIKSAQAAFVELFNIIDYHIRDYFPAQSDEGKTRFFRTLKADYEMYNNFVLKNHKNYPELLNTMYNNQLRIKALLLNTSQKIKHDMLNSKDESLRKTFLAWQDERDALAKLYISEQAINTTEIKALEDHIETLEVQLSSSSSEFNSHAKRSKPETWQNVMKALNKDQAIVEIVRFRDFDFRLDNNFGDGVLYGALIISGNTKSIQLMVLNNGKELEGKYYNYYSHAIQSHVEDSHSYSAFWSPLEKGLKDIKEVNVSPDGVFYKINLNTLFDPTDGKFVLEKFHITLLTNSRDLLDPIASYGKSQDAVLVGFPNYTLDVKNLAAILPSGNETEIVRRTDDLSETNVRSAFKEVTNLPGTLIEVDSIELTLRSKGWRVTKYLQDNAREENVKMQVSPRILHIATHGYFEPTDSIYNPLLASGLLLAGASVNNSQKSDNNFDDGVLTAYEAMNLNLDQTQIVILSACETGKGVIQNGEGVYGLQSAFKVAGARNIIMSLWKVDDRATQKLMTSFYKRFSETGNVHTSFQEAQLTLKKEYVYPFYWGAFVLIGL